MLGAAALVSIVWLSWRATHLGTHPIQLLVFATEVAAAAVGVVVGAGLAASPRARSVYENDQRESFRFAFAVADIVGRTRASDLRADLRSSCRLLLQRRSNLADVTIAAVLIDGPRRLVVVVSLTLALLLGVAPMALPPTWAIACGMGSMALLSGAHILLGQGRIRVGDRVRWSSSALGEFCAGTDRDGIAPRRWVGTVAAVVALNLAIALRGTSDRWTHGFAPMTSDGRHVTMLLAIIVVIGGLYTLRTTTAPQIENAHLVSRRIEERTARRSAIGAAVSIGLIGLLAGILPGDVDATDEPARIEQISNRDSVRVEGIDRAIADMSTGGLDG